MDESLSQWLVYLGRRQSDVEANRRSRTPLFLAFGGLLIASVLYWSSGGYWLLAIFGVLLASVYLVVLYLIAMKEAAYLLAVDGLIKRILIGQLTDSAAVNRELNSRTSIGAKEYLRQEIGRRMTPKQ